jgi:hypothetical protein
MQRPAFVTNREVLKTGSLTGVCGRPNIKGTKMARVSGSGVA